MTYKAKVNGKIIIHRRRVALEIIKIYQQSYKATLLELRDVFDTKKYTTQRVFMDKDDKHIFIEERSEKEFKKRYFAKSEDAISMDNSDVYVTNQWGDDDRKMFTTLLTFAKEKMKLDIVVLSD